MLRSLEDPTTLKRYLELKAEARRIDEELKGLHPLIYDALTDEPAEEGRQSVSLWGHTLTARVRKTYQYSDKAQALSAQLREMKRMEERDGTAQIARATGYVEVRTERLPFPKAA